MSTAKPCHVLVVDDDDRIRTLLVRYLQQNGYQVSSANCAAHAREVLGLFRPDICVVDVMMPGDEDGLGLCEFVRGALDIPVILLTALGEATDRIAGLKTGADDYMVKPFEPEELTLRISSVLRRGQGAQANDTTGVLRFGPYVFDRHNGDLVHDGDGSVPLSDTERALLVVLSQRPNVPLRREALIHALSLSGNERTIDVQVARLRRKLGDDGAEPKWLITLRGKGYMLRGEHV